MRSSDHSSGGPSAGGHGAGRLTRRLFITALAGVVATALASPSHAQNLSLDQARAQGFVGEEQNGYLGVVQNAPGVSALVQSVNAQRRMHYESIAAQNGVPLSVVEAQAGQNLISRLPNGAFYRSNGSWARR